MVALFVVLAATQGVVTQHLPEILESLAGAEMSSLKLPDPSWQQAYAGWLNNLTQIFALALLTINAIGYAGLGSNGDIPFILTKKVKRSRYLSTGVLVTWCAHFLYAVGGAVLAWAGTVVIFPEAPFLPALWASCLWAVEITLISGFQLLASTLKSGTGAPLLAGIAVYLALSIAAIFDKVDTLSSLSATVAAQQPVGSWVVPVAVSLLLAVALLGIGVRRFNRREL